MKRNYDLDLARIVLSICVITLHSLNHFEFQTFHFSAFFPVILISADGVFYLLSGYFNLEKEFNNSSDILKFYKNKIINILFPFLAFVFVWTVWDYIHINDSFNLLECLSLYLNAIIDTEANGHLWFMYPLFGLLLSTPFLSKMLHNMDEKELRILWYIALGFNFVCYYLCMDMGVGFRVLAWFLDGWPIYYIGGYYYRHVISKEKTIKWIILGALGFVVTILGSRGLLPLLKNFAGATDIQPMFTLFCIGCLMFWDKAINIKNEKVQKVIGFLSKNTFLIYMYHMRGIEYAVRKLSITEPSLLNGILVVAGSFTFSLIAAYITNLCLKPVQKLIDKVWKIN